MQTLSVQFYKTLQELEIRSPHQQGGILKSEFTFLIELWYVCDTKKEFVAIAEKFKEKEGYSFKC